MIYADYAATTPLDSHVKAVMEPFLAEQFYNPSAVYPAAQTVRHAIRQARELVADSIGAIPEQVIFTSGGTEADNLAVLGIALHPQNQKRHIITSQIEHHAVLESCRWLETQGFSVTYLPVDCYGRISVQTLEKALTEDTFLVTLMWVNNELGTVQNIAELARTAHAHGALFHSDAVQAMTIQEVDAAAVDVDLLSISSHKIYGPKGCGALFARAGVQLIPLIHGGQQEGGLRGGTENAAGIVGMGEAARLLVHEKQMHIANMRRWKQTLIETVAQLPDVRINSPQKLSAPSVLHLAVRGMEAEGLLFWLARQGVQASMGSACNSQSVEPSHVVRAIGLPEDYARGCIRLSFGRGLDDEKIDALAQIVTQTIMRQREAAT